MLWSCQAPEKGLGVYIVLAYARAGATGICISSLTQSDLDSLEKQLKDVNPNLEILSETCDTTKPDIVKALAEKVKCISKYIRHGPEDGERR